VSAASLVLVRRPLHSSSRDTAASVLASLRERPIVIQHLSSTGDDDGRCVELSFGPNFGGIAFSYDGVAGFIRHARAEERAGDWIYRDARTGEAFDFARPFVGTRDPADLRTEEADADLPGGPR
jgi:hypothetical protein